MSRFGRLNMLLCLLCLLCSIVHFPHTPFCCNFRLAGNLIKSITKTTLANVTGIHVLNFAQNELEQIETGAFDNLKELRALRLDHNYLADINGLVSGKVIYN